VEDRNFEPTHRIIGGPYDLKEVRLIGDPGLVCVEIKTPTFGLISLLLNPSCLAPLKRSDELENSTTTAFKEKRATPANLHNGEKTTGCVPSKNNALTTPASNVGVFIADGENHIAGFNDGTFRTDSKDGFYKEFAFSCHENVPSVEITSKMIEAGRQVLIDALDEIGPTHARILAEKIFTSMLAAACKESRSIPLSN
jgi:hypothetical protein